MEVHILIHWDIGNGEEILAVCRDFSDGVAAIERIVSDFNANNPGRKMDGSRYVGERLAERHLKAPVTAAWNTGVSGWRIETHDVV